MIEDSFLIKLKGDQEPCIIPFPEGEKLIDFANHLYAHVAKYGFSGWSRVDGILINMSEVQVAYPAKNPQPETESEEVQ